jgi:hypothetical protein
VKPSKKYPVILTLNGHYSHSKNTEVIEPVLGKTGCTLFVYEVARNIGKPYFKSATVTLAANMFRITDPFPYNCPCLKNMIPEESQRSSTSYLLGKPVPYTRIAEEPPTTLRHKSTDPNQQSLCLPHRTPVLLKCRPTLKHFEAPLAGNKNSQQSMSITGKSLLLY